MRRLPPPVRARACRSAYRARVRACVCSVTRGTRASAHAQTIFFSRASCNHLMPYLGPRTATRPFAVSFSFPPRPPPSLLLSFSPPHHLFLRLLSPFPPRAFLSLVPDAFTRVSLSFQGLSSPFLLRSSISLPSSRATLGWMKCSRKTARGRTNDRVKRGY